MRIPSFTKEGLLPEGTYELTIEELRRSYLVTGEGVENPAWDARWRRKLVDNLEILASQLRKAGIPDLFIGGSFVENKSHPNDIDGWFPCDLRLVATGELMYRLNDLDPFTCWTWDPRARRKYRGYPKGQLPMWHRYRVELWPDYGQPFGLQMDGSLDQGFEAAFRRSRSGAPRGVIKIRGEHDSNRGGVSGSPAPRS